MVLGASVDEAAALARVAGALVDLGDDFEIDEDEVVGIAIPEEAARVADPKGEDRAAATRNTVLFFGAGIAAIQLMGGVSSGEPLLGGKRSKNLSS